MATRAQKEAAKRAAFLDALAHGYTVTGAARKAGVVKQTVYNWRNKQPTFATAWDEALEDGTDTLEDEARRRAVEGVEDTVYYRGEPCGTVRRYSDFLLGVMLKARRPAIFRDSFKAEVTGADGAPLLSDDERAARIASLMALGAARAGGGGDGSGDG